jgi:hypothetical protein
VLDADNPYTWCLPPYHNEEMGIGFVEITLRVDRYGGGVGNTKSVLGECSPAEQRGSLEVRSFFFISV